MIGGFRRQTAQRAAAAHVTNRPDNRSFAQRTRIERDVRQPFWHGLRAAIREALPVRTEGRPKQATGILNDPVAGIVPNSQPSASAGTRS
jgi:hypothetical protein